VWRRFNIAFACTLLAGVGGAFLFVLLVDPLGVSPLAIFSDQNIVYNNRRQAMPQIIRSGRYDSFIVGSSTTITLDPKWAEAAFGGRFANIAIHGATPYEQSRVLELIGREGPKTIVHGLDASWCAADMTSRYHPWWPFPEWLYDDVRPYDLRRLLNWHFIRLAVSKARLAFGFDPPMVLANGFETQLPKDSTWDLAKARARIYAPAADTGATLNKARGVDIAESAPASTSFPNVDLLREAISKIPASTQLIVLFMPVHSSTLPMPGTEPYNRLELCKQRVAEAVRRPNSHVIDFMRRSPLTDDDSHFWDSLHVRDAVAANLVERTREAVEHRDSSSDGVYRYLSGPTGRPEGLR
jgi:hypothetical protein